MICKKCGEEIPDESKFCYKCGKNLTEDENVTPKKSIPIISKFFKNKKTKSITIIAIIILVLIMIVFFSKGNKVVESSNNSNVVSQNTTTTPKETEEEKKIRLEEEKKERQKNIAELKEKAQVYTYEQLARNPEAVKGQPAKVTGEVIQALYDTELEEDTGRRYVYLRVNITKTTYKYIDDVSWSDTIMIMYIQEKEEDKILENDIVTIYGYTSEEYTYESTIGAPVTLPCIVALSVVQGEE